MVLVGIAVALSLCAGRLLQLQGFESAAYAATSAAELTRTLPLLPSRGEITDRNGVVLAATVPAVAITADPSLTAKNSDQIVAILHRYLPTNPATLHAILTTPNKRFVYVAKKVPAETYSKIAADLASANLYGVFRESDPIRSYPGASLAAGVVGFVGANGQGLGGLELSRNSSLAGVEGKETYQSDPNGGKIPLGASTVTPAVDGTNYQLTIDSNVQWVTERRLAAQVQQYHAKSGYAVVLNVKTGEILALANAPGFNSANPGASAAALRGNAAISDAYEPGSVEKLLTSAALIDSGYANPETKVAIPSTLASGGGRIHDVFVHGRLDLRMRGVIAESSNIGTTILARQMPKHLLRSYLASFGLGSRTGLGLPAESNGYLPPANMPDYTRDQMSFGQGLSLTSIQMAAAVAAVANGGVYHAPTILKSTSDDSGRQVPVPAAAPRRVISAAASAQVRDLMQAVVVANRKKRDPNAWFWLPGYLSGGKTGTAQEVDPTCGCYRNITSSYLGVAPLNDPQILTYVVINNPRGQTSGTYVGGPAVKDIFSYVLPHYNIAPSKAKPVDRPITW